MSELQSIAFIPDGNRRYARLAGISLAQSYYAGTQKAWSVLEWLLEYPKIFTGTFWMLSAENFQRNRTELELLYQIFSKEIEKVKASALINDNKVKVQFVGRKDLLPKSLQQKMGEAERHTARFDGKTANIAIGYGGRMELVDAAKKFATEAQRNPCIIQELDENSFKKYLYGHSPDPDLVVRTSGTQRLSGFMPYQSAYSELYFTPKYWPEFEREDLAVAVEEYYNRKRNFGK